MRRVHRRTTVAPGGAKRAFNFISARQARARVAAFVTAIWRRAHPRLLLVFHRQNPVADAQPVAHHQIHQPTRRFIRHDLEMIGLAADHAAQRDKSVIMSGREPDRAGNFQRARHLDAFRWKRRHRSGLSWRLRKVHRRFPDRNALPRSVRASRHRAGRSRAGFRRSSAHNLPAQPAGVASC